MRRLILILVVSLFCLTGKAQLFEDQYFRKEAEKGLNLIYNFEFNRADSLLQGLKGRYADHPAPYFLLALNRWWQTYISETSSTWYSYIVTHLDKAIELNKNYNKRPAFELEYTFFQYMNFAFKARFYILIKEYLKAANAGRKAIPHLKRGFEFVNQAPEFYFSSGIYHYYAEAFPKAHPIVRPFTIFFPDGDIEQGLAEMEKASQSFNFAQVESMYYLGDIYLHEVGETEKGLAIARKLRKSYPRNTLFRGDYARALVFNGHYEEAENLLRPMISRYESLGQHATQVVTANRSVYTSQVMINVYQCMGMIAFHRDGALQHAMELFTKSNQMARLARIESSFLLPYNSLYIGLCYDRLGQREQARQAYKAALGMDDSERIKKKARDCLKTPCLE